MVRTEGENPHVREIEGLRPRLREDLRFSIQEHRGERLCMVEDPVSGRFHRMGLAEFQFARALDGRATVAELLARLAREKRVEGFSEGEALRILSWLWEQGLLVRASREGGARVEPRAAAPLRTLQWLNPLCVRVPLGCPDGFFVWLERWMRWALGGGGCVLWCVVVAAGALAVGMNSERFGATFDGFLSRENWWALALVWLLLKVVHECGHGVFCTHFGARVREAGVIFVLFIPIGYVDATASVGLASRRQRMMVSAAGLYAEFFAAAAAALVWAATPPGLVNTLAHNAVITGTVLTAFFNLNPLMRFDGYFLLSEALDIPNLASRGRQWWLAALRWALTGLRGLAPTRPRSIEQFQVAAYGAAAWVWQVLVLAGLVVAAGALLRGGGLLLSAVAVIAWFALPLGHFFGGIARELGGHPARWAGFLLRAGVAVALVAGLWWLPTHRTVRAHAVVELAEAQVLRADCPGFLEALQVADGQRVAAGSVVAVLRNEEMESRLRALRWELQQQQLRVRVAQVGGDLAAAQAEQARVRALRDAQVEQERLVASLKVRAPRDGIALVRDAARLPGRFFQHGEEICRVGRPEECDLRTAVRQADEGPFRARLGESVEVRIEGRSGMLRGTVVSVDAQAGRVAPHPVLGADAGGPLDLRRKAENAAPRESAAATDGRLEDGAFELAEPHFAAVIRVAQAGLRPGEVARVRFPAGAWEPMGNRVRAAVERWWRGYAGAR
jgi:putative peptide zinc metalloprotease protein